MNKNSGTTNLVRPAFGPGMLLQHQDLDLLGSYTRDLSRMLFKSFFGCGVVCGLTVSVDSDCGQLKITVERGVALTCSGDPVSVSDRLEFYAEKTEPKPPLYVVLCRHTKHFGPRTPMCETDGESSAGICTREIDCYKVIVKENMTGDCGCPEPKSASGTAAGIRGEGAANDNDCYKDHNAGKCGCGCGDCADAGSGCVVLAKLVHKPKPPQGQGIKDEWMADHSVRRFIRPMLLPDPQVAAEKTALTAPVIKSGAGAGDPPKPPPRVDQGAAPAPLPNVALGSDAQEAPVAADEIKPEKAVRAGGKARANRAADKTDE